MGGGQYSFDVAREARSRGRGPGSQAFDYSGYGVDAEAATRRRGVDRLLDVHGRIRECMNDQCIVVAMDVTRSRGNDAKVVYERLPQLIGWLELQGYLPGAGIALAAVGDATVDRAPLQVSQWERDNRLDEALGRFWLEEGGGGTGEESYELVAYYFARHTRIRINEEGRRGYFFFVGDERYYPRVKREEVERVLGQRIPDDIPAAQIFRELRERFHVFFVYPKTSLEARRADIDAEIAQRVRSAGGRYDDVDVRVSLIWNTRDDLDLHVIAPSGDEIWYGIKESRCGGVLDVDRNVRGETLKPVENVRWPSGRAPRGRYTVYVQNYRYHEPERGPVPFRVEIAVGGRISHFDGLISPKGETGRASDCQVESFVFDPQATAAAPARGAAEDPYAGYDDSVIRKAWDAVLEEGHLLGIDDPEDIIEVIVGAIGLTERRTDLEGYLSALERESDTGARPSAAGRGGARRFQIARSLEALAAGPLPVAELTLADLPSPG